MTLAIITNNKQQNQVTPQLFQLFNAKPQKNIIKTLKKLQKYLSITQNLLKTAIDKYPKKCNYKTEIMAPSIIKTTSKNIFNYIFPKITSRFNLILPIMVLFMAFGLSLSFTVLPANAQSNGNGTGTSGQEPIVPSQSQICGGDACPVLDVGNVKFATKEDFADFIIRIAQFLTYIGVALAVLFLVIGGIQFMLGKSEVGWKTINTTLIGVVVIIISYTAVALITQFLTGDLLGQTITGTGVGSSASSVVR